MEFSRLVHWLIDSLLLSLRIGPAFAFAPPFTLVPAPAIFRALLALGLAACLVASTSAPLIGDLTPARLIEIAVRELMVGLAFVLALQLMFAALYTAGRTIDIQAGYGLALLIDPASQGQTPLVGALFAYAAGGVFFALNGAGEILQVFAASLRSIPLGAALAPTSLAPLLEFISAVFLLGFGVGGGVILCLFIADLAIAMMSRTVPQMNVLVLGLQAKTLVTLLVLPTVLGASGALLLRMMRLTLDAIPRLL